MTINFIPNDPNARDSIDMRQQPARPDRTAGRADFNFEQHNVENPYELGTRDFLFWQSREAALAAVETWEGFAGDLARWADRSDDPSRIDLSPVFDDGRTFGPQRLNAYYDGQGVRFFDFDNGTETIFSGNSTDTVSHEVGHALLDSQRPELFGSLVPEEAAFHESFGDCIAILTSLSDRTTRVALLRATPDLSAPNFVEATSEYLAAAARKQFGNVAPSLPRRALNTFKWQLPSTLPAGRFQDPPELLSREAHSFSRVFTGCLYDLLRAIFTSGGPQDEAALAAAAVKTGQLLVAAARVAPASPRFFQAVGRAMVKADEQQNDGDNRERIGKAFADHGVMLGSSAMIAPTAALAGPSPKVLRTKATLAPSTLADLRERMHTKKGAKLAVRPLEELGKGIAEVVHRREIPLGSMDKRLRGVVAIQSEPVLVGSSGARAALLGALPEMNRTEDEVGAFVETLLANDRIAMGAQASALAGPSDKDEAPQPYTHVVRSVGGKKVLMRVRFLCGCGCGGTPEGKLS
jgi:hypothetical protein